MGPCKLFKQKSIHPDGPARLQRQIYFSKALSEIRDRSVVALDPTAQTNFEIFFCMEDNALVLFRKLIGNIQWQFPLQERSRWDMLLSERRGRHVAFFQSEEVEHPMLYEIHHPKKDGV